MTKSELERKCNCCKLVKKTTNMEPNFLCEDCLKEAGRKAIEIGIAKLYGKVGIGLVFVFGVVIGYILGRGI